VTTDDLRSGQPAATRRLRRGAFRALCCAVLCAASLSSYAQSAPAAAATPVQATAATPSTQLGPFGDDLIVSPAKPAAETPKLGERIQGLLAKAMTLLGTPYRWGGEDPEKGLDCSGLVGYVFRTALGIDLPRVSRQMFKSGEAVADRAALTPGDLVFFGRRGRVSHVGIYVGDGRFLHAPSRGKDVRVDSLLSGYWSGRFMQGRRVASDS
jgi:cell wall-associated NlpC family hydrolase